MPKTENHNIKAFRGVTLLELLIGISVIIILAALGIGAFSNFRENSNLNSAPESGGALLAEARSKTLSSEDDSQYGVHFETNEMTFFKGASYSASDPDNDTVVLPRGIEMSAISLNGGGVDVLFERLTGKTDQYGTITFRIISDTSKTRTITILNSGSIQQ